MLFFKNHNIINLLYNFITFLVFYYYYYLEITLYSKKKEEDIKYRNLF